MTGERPGVKSCARRILLMDDHDAVRTIAGRVLQHLS